MPRRTGISSILIVGAGLLVAVGAGIAWYRPPQAGEAGSPRYLEIRLAQAEELAPRLKAADSMGEAWARHFDENLPARAARACGARRFDALAASDFFQAVEIPASDATLSLVQCMEREGGGYLRFAASDRQER